MTIRLAGQDLPIHAIRVGAQVCVHPRVVVGSVPGDVRYDHSLWTVRWRKAPLAVEGFRSKRSALEAGKAAESALRSGMGRAAVHESIKEMAALDFLQQEFKALGP